MTLVPGKKQAVKQPVSVSDSHGQRSLAVVQSVVATGCSSVDTIAGTHAKPPLH